ncbi:MAG TPA: anti-sigma factor, partial [Candidatus Limnocylindria bacterium]|nr:anti-sigma factor [Candidatus Limnocylindria bacterium]
ARAGALALGAVDADELRAAREHLATCREPHLELRSILGADAALVAGLEPIQPSAGLRDRLMASVAATPQERTVSQAATAPPEEARPPRRGWLDWLSPNVARPLAVAAVVALVALGVWGYSVSSQLNEQRDALRAVAEAIAAGEPAHPVEGSAGGGFVVDTAGAGSSFVVTDANALEANQLYVLWLIGPDGTPVDVGAFEPGDGGAVVAIDEDLSGFDIFAVTVEAERVDAPTSDPVMLGAIQG